MADGKADYKGMDKPPGTDFEELGDTGLKRTRRGIVLEEYLPILRGQRGIKTYSKMGTHPIVGAELFAIDMLMRQVKWRVDKVSEDNADVEAADFVFSCMNDMSHSWTSFISEVLSMIQFGFSPHEIVYKRRSGKVMGDAASSIYNDGRIGWRKMPIRAQDTLQRWGFDQSGGVQGMYQTSPHIPGRNVFIPIEKMLLFRTTEKKGDPEGRSALRAAYEPWFYARRIQNFEAIGIERDLAGLPRIGLPADLLSKNATEQQKALLAFMQKMGRNLRRDEQDVVIYPLEYDENGKKKYEFDLMTSGGTRQFNTNEIIQRYARWIAMTVLADFILLGHEKVGSYSLSSSKTNLFGIALGAWLDMIAEVLNRFAIPRLLELNAFPVTEYPRIIHGDIETPDLKELGEFIKQISGAGFPLFPDDDLEAWIRSIAGMPSAEKLET